MAGRDLDRGRFLIPNPITVTLTRPASYGKAAASITVGRVQDQASDEQPIDTPEGGSLVGTKRKFHLWLVECLLMPPHEGYEITMADGTIWAVKQVEVLAHGRRFRCHCTRRRNTS